LPGVDAPTDAREPALNTFLRVSALLALSSVPAGLCTAQDLPDTASARFEALDVNGDGGVSKYEYDSDVVLATMDSDHNTRISAAELQAFLGAEKDGAPSASYRISVADVDDDGELSDAEIRRGMEFRFQYLDGNKDGNIDPAELKAGLGVPMVR
jgi:Ca2+-binding EF-hand superfamily protein